MIIIFIPLNHMNHITRKNTFRVFTAPTVTINYPARQNPVKRSGMAGTMVRMLAFTDFHGNLEAFRKAKELIQNEKPHCVLVAGDIHNYEGETAKRHLTELAEADVPLFFVPGNMDSPDLASWPGTESVRPLHGKSAKVGAVFLVGLGGSPPGPFPTPFQISDERAARLLEQAVVEFKGGSLVLVSHCPPQNTKLDLVPSGEHAGSMAVRHFVEKFKPALVVSGHIHEAKGVDSIGETVLVNTGPAHRGDYAEIRLEGRVMVRLHSLV
jgi:Icc-related predicted phosphoesterase